MLFKWIFNTFVLLANKIRPRKIQQKTTSDKRDGSGPWIVYPYMSEILDNRYRGKRRTTPIYMPLHIQYYTSYGYSLETNLWTFFVSNFQSYKFQFCSRGCIGRMISENDDRDPYYPRIHLIKYYISHFFNHQDYSSPTVQPLTRTDIDNLEKTFTLENPPNLRIDCQTARLNRVVHTMALEDNKLT
jgi:hypothetical protein